jgi:hypothetical protein
MLDPKPEQKQKSFFFGISEANSLQLAAST